MAAITNPLMQSQDKNLELKENKLNQDLVGRSTEDSTGVAYSKDLNSQSASINGGD